MYFDHLKTLEEVKERYKILAKRLHPDLGGDKVIMQEVNCAYEKAIEKDWGYDEYEDNAIHLKIIKKVMDWADNNSSFDPSFILSLKRRLEDGKDLTEAQEDALENIVKKFKINIKEV